MQTEMQTDIMTIREISDYLKLTEKTAYRLVAEGKIPGFKVGGSWRFRRSELEHWIERKTNNRKLVEDVVRSALYGEPPEAENG